MVYLGLELVAGVVDVEEEAGHHLNQYARRIELELGRLTRQRSR